MRTHLPVVVLACLACLSTGACSRQASHDSAARSEPIAPAAVDSTKSSFGPTVAGQFYPADPGELRGMLRGFLHDAARASSPLEPSQRLVGLIVPHAGYVYSGAVAGRGWELAAKTPGIRTVVVMGPSHHRLRTTASTIDREVYRTPLGDVPIALDVVKQLVDNPSGLVKIDADVLAPEHSVDVQVPFIQMALPSARLVPIVVPFMSEDRLDTLAGMLFDLLGKDPSALIVASSDLAHYFDYPTANSLDEQIEREIVAGDVSSLLAHHDERRGPCGVAPITVLLDYEKRLGPTAKTVPLEMINSGDTAAGDKSRVVGYLAAAVVVGK